MGTTWGVLPAAMLVVAVLVAGCAGRTAGAQDSQESSASLPIASAPPRSTEVAAPSKPASVPVWDEPEDPVEAYRVLIDKVEYVREHPSVEMFREIYAPNQRMAPVRTRIERMVEVGERQVGGRTVLEEVLLQAKDDNAAVLRVRAREAGWVIAHADGRETQIERHCTKYVVELRRRGEGWRIAGLTFDDDEGIRRC